MLSFLKLFVSLHLPNTILLFKSHRFKDEALTKPISPPAWTTSFQASHPPSLSPRPSSSLSSGRPGRASSCRAPSGARSGSRSSRGRRRRINCLLTDRQLLRYRATSRFQEWASRILKRKEKASSKISMILWLGTRISEKFTITFRIRDPLDLRVIEPRKVHLLFPKVLLPKRTTFCLDPRGRHSFSIWIRSLRSRIEWLSTWSLRWIKWKTSSSHTRIWMQRCVILMQITFPSWRTRSRRTTRWVDSSFKNCLKKCALWSPKLKLLSQFVQKWGINWGLVRTITSRWWISSRVFRLRGTLNWTQWGRCFSKRSLMISKTTFNPTRRTLYCSTRSSELARSLSSTKREWLRCSSYSTIEFSKWSPGLWATNSPFWMSIERAIPIKAFSQRSLTRWSQKYSRWSNSWTLFEMNSWRTVRIWVVSSLLTCGTMRILRMQLDQCKSTLDKSSS